MFESLHAAVCVSSRCDLVRHASFPHRSRTAGHRLLFHPEILQSRIKVTKNVSCSVLSRLVLLDLIFILGIILYQNIGKMHVFMCNLELFNLDNYRII